MVKPDFTAWLRARTVQDGDCRIWQQSVNSTGYPQCSWEGKGGTLVSRLVLDKLRGIQLTSRQCAVPVCGNRLCVSELCLKARSRNSVLKEAYASRSRCNVRERKARRERTISQGWAKLDYAKAAEIRLYQGKQTATATAAQFGVSQKTVSLVWKGIRWPENDHAANASVFTWRPAA